MSTLANTMKKPRLSWKAQLFAAVGAMIGAVALPQIFHLLGAAAGLGTALGETFLPMHLPILLVGFLAGPYAGAVSGFLAPLASFALSGMPGIVMLPFMMLELCAYGLFAGLLREKRMPVIVKLLLAQSLGRLVRAAAILAAVYGFGYQKISVSVIWTSIRTGLFGLVLQWTFIPLILFWVEHRTYNEN